MSTQYDCLVRGGRAVTPAGVREVDIAIRDGRIADLGAIDPGQAGEVVDATGLTVLPGVIDTQVHFREPGATHKEDLESGTRAAALGGVTSVFEMPNTKPPTTDADALRDKFARCAGRAWVDHAFFVGGTPDNAANVAALERLPGCAGIKVFMGSSTGSLLVEDDDHLDVIARHARRRFAVHAEDEPRLRERRALVEGGADVGQHPVWRDPEAAIRATRRITDLCRRHGARVQVLHISTAEEMDLLQQCKDVATVEVTPQHLTLAAPDCYDRWGSHAQMNPPIRDRGHQDALWRAVDRGVVDVMGSDHAPHTAEEKTRAYPDSPSGIPGVQTTLPLMLDHAANGRLSLERVVDLLAAGPARVYNIARKGRIAAGFDADLALVDLNAERRITADWLASKAGFSPFLDRRVRGWPVATMVRGRVVARDGQVVGAPAGRPVRFLETLGAGEATA